jgi:hypothetical protein
MEEDLLAISRLEHVQIYSDMSIEESLLKEGGLAGSLDADEEDGFHLQFGTRATAHVPKRKDLDNLPRDSIVQVVANPAEMKLPYTGSVGDQAAGVRLNRNEVEDPGDLLTKSIRSLGTIGVPPLGRFLDLSVGTR